MNKKPVYVLKLVNNELIVGTNLEIVEGGVRITFPLCLKEDIKDETYECFLTSWIPLAKYGMVEILATSVIAVVSANDQLTETYNSKLVNILGDNSKVITEYIQPMVNTIQ